MTTIRTPRRCEDIAMLMEWLEPRVVLAGEPFPTLAMLEDVNNAVVRMETQFGVLDVELFNAAAPTTIAGFLGVTADGEYDQRFFHRLTTGLTLAGGLFGFDDTTGLSVRESAYGVDAAFVRSNVERTIAVRVEPAATTTTGEWIINLADNSATHDGQWLVIGRVIQGWEVVQQVISLPVFDLSGFFPGNPNAPALTNVPVTSITPPPTAVTEGLLVFVNDIELIKPGGQTGFFEHRIYFPEGFSHEQIFEAIELVNPGVEAAEFQVLVRYETGPRDQVILTGSLEADHRRTLVVAPGGEPSTVVRNEVPYAYEVWSTRPLAGGFRHQDFGSGVGEAFFNPASLSDPAGMLDWTFTQAALGFAGSRVFILWQNTTGTDTPVTVTFYFQDADPIELNFALDGHRRGGVDVLDLTNLPPGTAFVGARVRASEPIVVSVTRYDEHADGTGSDEGGISALGTFGGGATEGVAPGARRGGLDPVAVLNTGGAPVEVRFFVTEEGSPTTVERAVTVAAGRLVVLDGDDNPASSAPPGKLFTIRYEADAPVTVSVLTSAFRGTGTGFATQAAEVTHFADARAFTAPNGSPFGQQAISVFNPGLTEATYRIVFRFSDGSKAESEEFALGALSAAHNRINSFNQLISGVLGGLGGFAQRPYSIEVISSAPIVAQAVQLNGDGKAELGTTLIAWTALSSIG